MRRSLVRCVIVDDSRAFRESARRLLEFGGADIVGMASNSADARASVDELHPDVTLVDVHLGAESGFDLARELASGTAVILTSTAPETDLAERIAASPARGFVAKAALSVGAIQELLRA